MVSFIPQEDGAIRTRRLLLRGAQESDLEALHQLFSDEDVMRYWSCAPHTRLEQTAKYLHGMTTSPTNGTLDFVIVLLDPPSARTNTNTNKPTTHKVIGKAGIWTTTNFELGFLLHRAYWKQGLMTEALSALLGPRGALWERGVTKVLADVDPRNESSVGLLRRLGFGETGREERTFETHLGWCDSVYLELREGEAGWGRGGA